MHTVLMKKAVCAWGVQPSSLFLAGEFQLMHIRAAAIAATSTPKFVRFFEISAWIWRVTPSIGCAFRVFLDKQPIITQITSRYGRTT